MKYLCVGYFTPAKMDALSKTQVAAVMSECPAHMKALYKTGKVLVEAGADVEAKSLRRVNGKVEVSDGSNQASAEKIGCVFVVEARNMADAVRVAALHPTTQISAGEQLGWRMEIRPVHSFKERPLKKSSR